MNLLDKYIYVIENSKINSLIKRLGFENKRIIAYERLVSD